MINIEILRKCGGGLENSINCRYGELILTEYFINDIPDIITRTRTSITCSRNPMESKIAPMTSREDRIPEEPVLKCHKCGRTSHLAHTFTKNTQINEAKIIEGVQLTEDNKESDHDSAISDDTPEENYPI
ncbi:hypothetical protein O181_006263 [Austropuccinia psidii MF-1]|uniref:Uncharacterized protein n=1 Tax=Austropuccinia psidii MF-1 TaxID=1389203 RepID=A0A9Q3BJW0_9BASI|nr:hypothetical protein [Austropuccinia psidii MF-1]